MANTTIAGLPTLTPISSCAAIPVCSGNVTYNVTVGNLKTFVNSNGTSNISIAIANANITVGVSGTANVIQWASTGEYVAGEISATGNIKGNYFVGNGSQLTGIITAVSGMSNGSSNVNIASANANITVGVSGTANVIQWASTGEYVAGEISATGNITGNYILGNGSQLTGVVAVGNATPAVAGVVYGRTIPGGAGAQVSLGACAGRDFQATCGVAVGTFAGAVNQGYAAVAVGRTAGGEYQGQYAVAAGLCAGKFSQGDNSVAIGVRAAYSAQGTVSVAIGSYAGYINQGTLSVAIGCRAGGNAQGNGAISLGIQAGNVSQGCYAIAIGYQAGKFCQAANSIAIGSGVAAPNAGFYVSPVRCVSIAGAYPVGMGYCTTNKEIVYGFTPSVSVTQIINGASSVDIASADSNITVNVGGIPNIVQWATTGEYVTGEVSATGNVTGGNILTGGSVSVAGNATIAGDLTVSGNVTFIDADVIVTNDLYIQLANNQSTYANINNSGLSVGTSGNALTYWQYKNTPNAWTTNVAISATANIIGGNIRTVGLITATGNVTGGNILTAGLISATGNIYSGNLINAGTSSVTGNLIGGNILTAGSISATGNITAIAATGSSTSAANSVGYLGVPINSQSANYTLTISDQSKQIYFTAGAVLTVPSNANVAFPIGTAIGVIAPSSNVTVTINTDTMYLMGNTGGLTGNRVITAYGGATLTKLTSTVWYIGGAGVV